jgi:SAM-dependent methyltransferase
MNYPMTWEQAVCWLRVQPGQEELVRYCYYDDPLDLAARRFSLSAEWEAVRRLLPKTPGDVLDLGAGRGISSYAFAVDGWKTTALEPDPSLIVGSQAIRDLASKTGLAIRVVEEKGEALPFPDASFDVIYGRQILHHASDLSVLCKEIARTLRPGGSFIATREHVISKLEDLQIFLEGHPLHHLYGGENAYTLDRYLEAFTQGGLEIERVLGPFESPINYFPLEPDRRKDICLSGLSRFTGRRIARIASSERWFVGKLLLNLLAVRRSRMDDSPGRLYTFVGKRPFARK